MLSQPFFFWNVVGVQFLGCRDLLRVMGPLWGPRHENAGCHMKSIISWVGPPPATSGMLGIYEDLNLVTISSCGHD